MSRTLLSRLSAGVGLSAAVGIIMVAVIVGLQVLVSVPTVVPVNIASARVFASEPCPSNDHNCSTITATLDVIHRERVYGGSYENVQPITTTSVVITPKYYTKSGLAGCPCDLAQPSLAFTMTWNLSSHVWTAAGCVSQGIAGNPPVTSANCDSFAPPFTGLVLSILDSCGSETYSSQVSVSVGISATTSGICDIAAQPGTMKTYNATSADFLLYKVSKGQRISAQCTLSETDIFPTRGAYLKVIPVSCDSGGAASDTQYINYH